MVERDNTPIPFTVADRLLLEAVHEAITKKADRWEKTANTVESWQKTGRWIQGAAVVVVGWILSFLSWHAGGHNR